MPEIAWGYVRVSTDEQMKSTLGVRGYINTIIRYAESHDLDLGAETQVSVDGTVFDSRERIVIESISASKVMFFKRPGGLHLGNTVQPGEHLLIPKLDRAFRNYKDAMKTTDLLLEAGIRLTFLDMGGMDIDVSQGMGAVILAFFAMAAEWESAKISERTTQAHRVSRAAGRPAVCNAPMPFQWQGNGKHRKLVPDPRQLALLREIGTWLDAKWTFWQIYTELRRRRIGAINRSAKDEKQWGSELRETTARHYIREAKRMRTILKQTGIVPEAGQQWLDERYRQAEEEKAKRKAVMEQNRARAARQRLRDHLAKSKKGAA